MTNREVVVEAIRKAGNQKELAKVFGVAQSAISEWGRTRPIPRHVKPRLEDYVKSTPATVAAQPRAASPFPAPPNQIARLLRRADSLRVAFILNEMLLPPLSLREQRGVMDEPTLS